QRHAEVDEDAREPEGDEEPERLTSVGEPLPGPVPQAPRETAGDERAQDSHLPGEELRRIEQSEPAPPPLARDVEGGHPSPLEIPDENRWEDEAGPSAPRPEGPVQAQGSGLRGA